MAARRHRAVRFVFFCSLGWVCAGEALGQSIAVDDGGGVPTSARSSIFDEREPAAPEDESDMPAGQNVGINDYGQIDLHVKDLEVSKVLQLLSIQSQRNIIASKNVAGQISADLYGVDFYEALDAVLHPNGFGFVEKGNFIYVYTQQELAERQQAERKAVTRVVRLNHINAADAAAFVSPMISGSGSISVNAEAPQSMQPSITDAGSNSYAHGDLLVIRDYEENVNEILETLKELDVRPKQVLIEATILQARLTEANALGVDFAIFTDLNIENFATPLGAVNELISGSAVANGATSGTAITSTAGNTANGQSSIKLGFVGSDAAVFVRALQSVTDTNVLSNPKMLVLNRQRADLLVGERLGYLSTTLTDTASTSTVEFLDVGTQLTVRPFISNDGFIRLELRPSVSDGETVVQAGQIIPNERTSELTTNVIVKNAQTVILGGLFKEDITRSRQQTPFLGDVPILGEAFKGRDDNVERSEVIFMVKPTVMKDEALAKMGELAMEDSEFARAGARQGLLPWSVSKLSMGHLRDAEEAMAAGDTKKAKWHVNMALQLDPTMPSAIRLREAITAEKFYVPRRSILNDAIDTYIDEAAMVTEPVSDAAKAPADPAAAPDAPEHAPAQDSAQPIAAAVSEPTSEAGQEPVTEQVPAETAESTFDVESTLSEVEVEAMFDAGPGTDDAFDFEPFPADHSTAEVPVNEAK